MDAVHTVVQTAPEESPEGAMETRALNGRLGGRDVCLILGLLV